MSGGLHLIKILKQLLGLVYLVKVCSMHLLLFSYTHGSGHNVLGAGCIRLCGPFMGKMFLVVVDAHSKWLEVKMVPAATSKATIVCLQSIFATHGLPERVVTDNGSVFTSEEFAIGDSVFIKDFCPGSKHWLPGKIVELLGPVSARVKLLNGEFHRRHFDHI